MKSGLGAQAILHTGATSRASAKRDAFTLSEMLICVVIVGLLASVVMPALNNSNTQALEGVARVMASDLATARAAAIRYNTEWAVQFSLENCTYTLVCTGTGNPPALKNPLAGKAAQAGAYIVEIRRIAAPPRGTNGVRLAGVVLKSTQAVPTSVTDVKFGALGGTGPARNQDTIIWLTQGSGAATRYVRLTVSWVTGQVWVDRPTSAVPTLS